MTLLLGLLGCVRAAPPPSVELPVTPPAATNARALATAELVGSADVAAVDAIAATPCAELDPAALLAAGRYGWRVMVAGPEGPYVLGDTDSSWKGLDARLKQWAAADAKLVARCGGSGRTSVLVVADGASPWWESSAMVFPNADAVDLWLLVADPTPVALPLVQSAPPAGDPGPYMTLASSGRSWVLLGSGPSIPASEHPTATEAVARLASLPRETVDPQRTVLVATPERTWADAVAGLDALAGIGVVPTLGLTVTSGAIPWPRRSGPTPTATTRLTLGETVPVLAFAFPGYTMKKSPLLQVIGEAPAEESEAAHIIAIDRALGGAAAAPPTEADAPAEPGALPPFPYRREP